MGIDISEIVEIKVDGKWVIPTEDYQPIFEYRNRRLFAFLADICNSHNIIPISKTRGFPSDSEYLNSPYEFGGTIMNSILEDPNYDGQSWLTLKELLEFDYEQTFEINLIDYTYKFIKGKQIRTEVSEIVRTNYKDFIGTGLFEDLDKLKHLGKPEDVRIIFYFG